MKRISLMLFGVLLGTALMGQAFHWQESGQSEIPTAKLVNALRLLNTHEHSYMHENHRFADRDQMLAFLRQMGLSSKSSIDLENPKPYELSITTSTDGQHYQITLQRPSDMNEKSTWCKPAAFSDDRGVVFLGQAIGCEAASRQY